MGRAEVRHPGKLLIGGTWCDSATGDVIESVDPSTGRVWTSVARAGAEDVTRACAAAAEAMRDPRWRGLSATDRGGLLERLSRLVLRDLADLAYLEARDVGMTLADAAGDMRSVATWFRYYGGLCDKIQGSTMPARPGWHAYTEREPVGVVGAILPWNVPALMFGWKVAPALAAGNAVVVKPAEQTPVSALRLAELAVEAGLPPGVLNVLPGYGHDAGDALVRDPNVAKIAFTGEGATARTIAANAANGFKRLTLECGGKAPNIVFDDCDIDAAVRAAGLAAFRRTGQSCTAGSRILVQETVYDRFVTELAAGAPAVRVGGALDAGSDIGPQAHERQLGKTLEYVGIGRAEGAELLCGGGRPTGGDLGAGYFVQPTVFGRVTPRMRIAREEIFGPVACVVPFRDEEEALDIANDSLYGLTAGLWTGDLGRGHRMARELRAGSVWVNAFPAIHWTMPYGGVKHSGYGRENGVDAVLEYTTTKSVVIATG